MGYNGNRISKNRNVNKSLGAQEINLLTRIEHVEPGIKTCASLHRN